MKKKFSNLYHIIYVFVFLMLLTIIFILMQKLWQTQKLNIELSTKLEQKQNTLSQFEDIIYGCRQTIYRLEEDFETERVKRIDAERKLNQSFYDKVVPMQ